MKNDKFLQELTESGMNMSYLLTAGAMTREQYNTEILKAANDGKYIYVANGRIQDTIKESLIKDGFKVKCKWDVDTERFNTVVSWKKSENLLLDFLYFVIIPTIASSILVYLISTYICKI